MPERQRLSESAGTAGLHVFMTAGEESGDQLGGRLMRAIRAEAGVGVRFSGVGGPSMEAEGLSSLFPMDDLAVMGFSAVLARLRLILRRIDETAAAVVAANPDVLVLIDAQDFSKRVARKVRRMAPSIPIVQFGSPTVWAWRPGRAKAMRPHVDRLLAILPFEPEEHRKLGGPPCVYVGHPLIERVAELTPDAEDLAARAADPPLLLVLPGSRRQEIALMAPVFGEALALLQQRIGAFRLALPAVPRRLPDIEAAVAGWPVRAQIITDPAEKHRAFRRARAALATSGTVTLELGLAGVPLVGAYRVGLLEEVIGRMVIRAVNFLMVNLVLGAEVAPELLQRAATPPALAAAIAPLMGDTPERLRQVEAFRRLRDIIGMEGDPPSIRAAREILVTLRERRLAR